MLNGVVALVTLIAVSASLPAVAASVQYQIVFQQDGLPGGESGHGPRPAVGGFLLDEATGQVSNVSVTVDGSKSNLPGNTYSAATISIVRDGNGYAIDVVEAVPGNPGTPGQTLYGGNIIGGPHPKGGADYFELGVRDQSRNHVYAESVWSDEFNAPTISLGTYSFVRIAPTAIPLPTSWAAFAAGVVLLHLSSRRSRTRPEHILV